LNYTLFDQRQGVIIYIDGDFDVSRIGDLKHLVSEAMNQSKKITFDLSELKFLDSSGVGFILYECRKLIDRGYLLKFRNLPEDIWDLFDLLGVPYILGESIFQ
jgi:anti-anti-sigma factor